MKRIRILLFGLPVLWGDILAHVFRREADLEVIVRSDRPENLRKAAKRNRAAVVVTTIENPFSDSILLELLENNPRIRVYNINYSGDGICLCELHPKCLPLGQLAPEELAARIRERVDRPFRLSPSGNNGWDE